MPKEVIKTDGQQIGVHWWNPYNDNHEEYVLPIVSVSIDLGKNFKFDEDPDETYTNLFYNFESAGAVEDFITNLRRAKRKVFGSGRN